MRCKHCFVGVSQTNKWRTRVIGMQDMTPLYLKDLLRPYIPKRTLRSASMNLLDHEPYNLKGYGYRAFSVSAPRLWNSLPDHIRNSQSVEIFKSRVKTYLFSQAYPNF